MRLGLERARRRDRMRNSRSVRHRSIGELPKSSKRRRKLIARFKGKFGDGLSSPFVPGMYEGKTPDQVRSEIGTSYFPTTERARSGAERMPSSDGPSAGLRNDRLVVGRGSSGDHPERQRLSAG